MLALLASITDNDTGAHLAEPFVEAGVDLVTDFELLAAVRVALQKNPDLIDVWQGYSYDKRWTPSPYLDGVEVGHYHSGDRHVRRHGTTLEACADFVVTEVRWVVDRRVITEGHIGPQGNS